ncbi:MAG: hypothetical protein PVS2B1_24300 [Candidatus Dormibacteraceae bacterium]
MRTNLLRRAKAKDRRAYKAATDGTALSNAPPLNERLAASARVSGELTTIVLSDGTIEYQSPASAGMLGWHGEDLLGSKFAAMKLSPSQWCTTRV